MKYQFPQICHIDNVLPYVKDREEFVISEKEGGFTTVNYIVQMPDSFDCVIRRECRGIKFCTETGNILQRPFHKFFNVGEREETLPNNIDFSNVAFKQEKLDGSMIAPIKVPESGKLRLTTKMGINKISMQAEKFVAGKPDYVHFMTELMDMGYTPIFEWCSRKNRIVLDYPEDQLILLAVRDNVSGRYLKMDEVCLITAFDYSIKIAAEIKYNPEHDIKNAVNVEGDVITFDDGHKVKLKCDWYVSLHKIKSAISLEHNLVDIVINNKLDDILPEIDEELKGKIVRYQKDLQGLISTMHESATEMFSSNYSENRAEFAKRIASVEPVYRTILFSMYDKKKLSEIIVSIINKNITREARWQEFKQKMNFNIEWTGGMFGE